MSTSIPSSRPTAPPPQSAASSMFRAACFWRGDAAAGGARRRRWSAWRSAAGPPSQVRLPLPDLDRLEPGDRGLWRRRRRSSARSSLDPDRSPWRCRWRSASRCSSSNSARKRLSRPIAIAVELLAGIPSIVYGMWGLFVLAPWFATHVQTAADDFEQQAADRLGLLTQGVPNGANIFTASLILAIMILPYMAAVFRELLLTVPSAGARGGLRAGLHAVRGGRQGDRCPMSAPAWSASSCSGLGRASARRWRSPSSSAIRTASRIRCSTAGSTIASTIANEFAEATSDMHTSALIALGLVLFVLTFAVLAVARDAARRGQKNEDGTMDRATPPQAHQRHLRRRLRARHDHRADRPGADPVVAGQGRRRRHRISTDLHDDAARARLARRPQATRSPDRS